MNIKSNAAALIALVLASSAKAAFLNDILKPQAPPAAGGDPTVPTTPPGPGTGTNTTTTSTTTATTPIAPTGPVIPPTSPANQTTAITTTPVVPTTGGSTTSRLPTSTMLSVTATTTTSISPTPTQTPKDSGSSTQLATAGIVVGAVVVAAAIGIWVFRKWKLSPSRDFQSKIRGDDYADTDYPRSYENDTVRLHHMNDQPAEPAAAKSPYTANTAFPVEDQYYDANYASKDQSGGYGQPGYNDYGRGAAPGYDQGGYDQGGYDQGYNDHNNNHNNYGHDGYAQSNVGGYGHDNYAQSQVGGGYGGNQGAYNQGGYAPSQVGGGYQQHGGYEDYGRR